MFELAVRSGLLLVALARAAGLRAEQLARAFDRVHCPRTVSLIIVVGGRQQAVGSLKRSHLHGAAGGPPAFGAVAPLAEPDRMRNSAVETKHDSAARILIGDLPFAVPMRIHDINRKQQSFGAAVFLIVKGRGSRPINCSER